VALAELGRFVTVRREGTIHRKNLERVAYVMAEAAGRPPAEIILDPQPAAGPLPAASPVPLHQRNMLALGGGVPWTLPAGFTAD